ncbi:enoyl-CoA hydratase-related protein [Jatrophihabitans sp. DSM 45814]
MSVRQERREHVLLITLDRPAKRNAIDAELTRGIDDALNLLDDDQDLWVGIITGGTSYFSAGTDIKVGPGEPTARGGSYGIISRQRRKPLIAAVEGPALGGGMEIALACDLVVAAETATFGLPEVTIGVIPTCGGLFRGPRALPLNVAKQLVLTGQPLTAERAFSLGFVNDVTPPGGSLQAALVLAERICLNAPVSVQQSLHAVAQMYVSADELGWVATSAALDTIMASEDRIEGNTAFFERRPPRWTGR